MSHGGSCSTDRRHGAGGPLEPSVQAVSRQETVRDRRATRRIGAAGVLTAAVLGAALLTGCSGSDDPPAVSFDLPGEVPSDVTFLDPPPTAPPAPSFELELLDGTTLDLAEQWAERPVVLVFFESFCELCAQQQAEITELSEQYRDAILFVGVGSTSGADDTAEYVREHDIAYPVGLDDSGEVFRRYGVDEPPLVALIARGGQLVRGWPGGVEDLDAQLTRFVVAG